MKQRDMGRLGEELAAEILEQKGYTVVAKNVHSIYGEVDLIATGDGYICFIEVRTRRRGAVVSPEESITPAKRRKIILTSLLYLQNHPYDLQPRFDVFAVETDGERAVSYQHWKGVFEGGNDY
ncbi:MAG: YraN family protein [Oscillospiraceae bacterium]